MGGFSCFDFTPGWRRRRVGGLRGCLTCRGFAPSLTSPLGFEAVAVPSASPEDEGPAGV